MRSIQLAASMGIACALLFATDHPPQPPSLSQHNPPLGVSRWSTFGENAAERQIRIALSELPYFSVFDYVAYRVNGPVVTLYGAVMDPALGQDAEAVVRTIHGVEHVENLIRYLPNSPQDNRVRQRVFGALYGDRALSRYALVGGGAIRILVDRGAVTLEGQVANESDGRRAATLAASIPGVVHVTSHLDIVG